MTEDVQTTRDGVAVVRVRDTTTGHAITLPTSALDKARYKVLAGAPAIDRNGLPLPPAFNNQPRPKAADSPAPTTIPTNRNQSEEK